MDKKQFKDVTVMGLAMFAMFFGAGNLIFPSYLGNQAGMQWMLGFVFFIAADAGLALLTVYCMIKTDRISILDVNERLGKVVSLIVCTIVMLCTGPFFAAPRTAATSFEMGFLPLFPSLSSWVYGAIYFAIVLLCCFRRTGIIDIIGKFMTPALVLAIFILVIIGIFKPIGEIVGEPQIAVIKEGIVSGYQTMDVMAAITFVAIILDSCRERGYTDKKHSLSLVLKASSVAAISLVVVYLGLAFLGATTSGIDAYRSYSQAQLLVTITEDLAGSGGVIILAVMVFLACLTSAIGQITLCANYLVEIAHGKLSYRLVVIVIVIMSYFVSNVGLSTIISVTGPAMSALYPVLVFMLILNVFGGKIKNSNVFKCAALFSFLTAFCTDVLPLFGVTASFIKVFPLYSYGLAWILPGILGAAVGALIPSKPYVRKISG